MKPAKIFILEIIFGVGIAVLIPDFGVELRAGTLVFQPKADYPSGGMPYCVAVGDVNGDGKADLAVVNESVNTVSVLLNGAP